MITLYGIPTCGTVKKAQKWLSERKTPFTFVDFRSTPPARETIEQWVQVFGAKAMRNTSGKAYRTLPEDKKTWSDEEWIKRFAADPMLIKRPIITKASTPIQVGFRGTDDELSQRLLG